MIRVLFDARFITPDRTGVGRVTENLLLQLLELNHDLNLHVMHNDGLSDHLKGDDPVKVSTLFDSHPGGDFHRNVILRKILNDRAIDLFFSPAFYSIQKGRLIPQVVLIHDLAVFDQPGSENPAFRLYLRKMIESSVRNASVLTTPSEFVKTQLIDRFKLDNDAVHAIHLGVDPVFSQYDDARAEELREYYCLPSQFMLNVATIEPRKNLLNLLNAYSIYKRRSLNPLPLVLIGKDGFKAEEIHSRAERQDLSTHVRFLDYVPEEHLSLLFGMAYCLVYPSLYEGFGLPVIEAMAAGCPVISSNRTSLPEVAGEAAVLIDPEDCLGLATAIRAVTEKSGLRMKLSREGRERAASFTWQKTAEKYAEVFQVAIERCRLRSNDK